MAKEQLMTEEQRKIAFSEARFEDLARDDAKRAGRPYVPVTAARAQTATASLKLIACASRSRDTLDGFNFVGKLPPYAYMTLAHAGTTTEPRDITKPRAQLVECVKKHFPDAKPLEAVDCWVREDLYPSLLGALPVPVHRREAQISSTCEPLARLAGIQGEYITRLQNPEVILEASGLDSIDTRAYKQPVGAPEPAVMITLTDKAAHIELGDSVPTHVRAVVATWPGAAREGSLVILNTTITEYAKIKAALEALGYAIDPTTVDDKRAKKEVQS